MSDPIRAAMQAVPTAGQNPSWVKAQMLAAYDAPRPDKALDVERLARALHVWYCGEREHGFGGRPATGWACERGAAAIAREYAALEAER